MDADRERVSGRIAVVETRHGCSGETLDEFLKQYPGVSRENAIAALEEPKALILARFAK